MKLPLRLPVRSYRSCRSLKARPTTIRRHGVLRVISHACLGFEDRRGAFRTHTHTHTMPRSSFFSRRIHRVGERGSQSEGLLARFVRHHARINRNIVRRRADFSSRMVETGKLRRRPFLRDSVTGSCSGILSSSSC